MFQKIVLPHHQDQAVKKNEDSFELLDLEDESAVILLDMGESFTQQHSALCHKT
jgi:hypothetical protein